MADRDLTSPAQVHQREDGRLELQVETGSAGLRLVLLPAEAEALGRRLLKAAMSSGDSVTATADSVSIAPAPVGSGGFVLEFGLRNGSDLNILLPAEQAALLRYRIEHLPAEVFSHPSGAPSLTP
jgi:hypothetical protein